MILRIILLITIFYNIPVYAQEKIILEKEEGYYIEENNEETLEIIRNSSLFHKKVNLTKLYSVLDLIKMGVNPQESDELFTSGVEEVKMLSKSSISFYLNAIIYHSKSDWAVWVNNKKISQDNNGTDLEILKVNKHYIKCRWVTGYSKFVSILQRYYEEGNLLENINIIINDKIAIVDFTIKPNQSLNISDKVAIIEGR